MMSVHLVSLLELNVWQSQLPPRHFCQPCHLLLSDHDLMFEDVLLSFPFQSRYLRLHLSPNYCFLLLELCHLVPELITVYTFCHLADDDLTLETTCCNQCVVAAMNIHAFCFDTTNTLSTHFIFRTFIFFILVLST